MKPISFCLISLLIFLSPPSSAQTYKCSVGNRTVFSDTPCAGAKVINEPGRTTTSNAHSGDPKTLGANNCKLSVPTAKNWNDPESLRIGAVTGGDMEVIDFASAKIGARRYYVPVNEKNSYGTYIGEKNITCFTSQDGARVLQTDTTTFR